MAMPADKRHGWIDGALLVLTISFLLNYFKPSLLSLPTITTGGDTAGQFYAAWLMRHALLPHGLLSGWCPGNFAGYPIFHYYFPFPFLLISILSLACRFEAAFKWVTALGSLLTPLCAFASFRLLGVAFPGPVVAAVLTLPFLLNEGNSMWGGNIPSTLAGEFAYSLSFALSLLFLGSLYQGITRRRSLRRNALLLALIGLSHPCGLIFSGLMGIFFLFDSANLRRNAAYLAGLYVLSFLLMGFWIVPMLLRLGYTTPFNMVWTIHSWREALPVVLWPFAAITIVLSLGAVLTRRLSRPGAYLWFGVLLTGMLYLSGHELHVPDIRFVPYTQILLVLISCLWVPAWTERLRGGWVLPVLAALATMLWVTHRVTYIPRWVSWNYTGFERKQPWTKFQEICSKVSGTLKDPRVAYENSGLHNRFGTMRAFELLPYFSGRSTLEGLYLQDSLSSPFIYLIQAEISANASYAVPGLFYPDFNLKNGVRHLSCFNTQYLILVSEKAKQAAKSVAELALKTRMPPYEIYELKQNDGQYVVPLRYRPVLYIGKNWKRAAHTWFRHLDELDVPLVGGPSLDLADPDLAGLPRADAPDHLPRIPYAAPVRVHAALTEEDIAIETSEPGRPLLIRMSYHPGWQVEGARKIYWASPSFMLIFPHENRVRLHFGRGAADYAGLAATLLGILGCVFAGRLKTGNLNQQRQVVPQRTLTGLWILIFFSWAAASGWKSWHRPGRLEGRAMKNYGAKHFSAARAGFEGIIQQDPQSPDAERALFFAGICDINLSDTPAGLRHWGELARDFWDGPHAAEAYFHLWEMDTRLNRFPEARQAATLLFRDYPGSYWAAILRGRPLKARGVS